MDVTNGFHQIRIISIFRVFLMSPIPAVNLQQSSRSLKAGPSPKQSGFSPKIKVTINQSFFLPFINSCLETGDLLKVEAKIAEIAKIDIITKSRIIDVGDMQALEIVGYDNYGNMFSSLEGVKFEWAVSKCDHILDLVSIKVIFKNLASSIFFNNVYL